MYSLYYQTADIIFSVRYYVLLRDYFILDNSTIKPWHVNTSLVIMLSGPSLMLVLQFTRMFLTWALALKLTKQNILRPSSKMQSQFHRWGQVGEEDCTNWQLDPLTLNRCWVGCNIVCEYKCVHWGEGGRCSKRLWRLFIWHWPWCKW